MQEEREILIKKFKKEMEEYSPNWEAIIAANNISTEAFGKRFKEFRIKRQCTQTVIGKKLSYSKQSINKIECGKNKKIPVDRLDFMSGLFSVSVAYLLCLIENDGEYVDDTEYYFWEHPNNQYECVKGDVVKPRLNYPMEHFGPPEKTILSLVTDELEGDYKLISTLYGILITKKQKRKEFYKVLKFAEEIL